MKRFFKKQQKAGAASAWDEAFENVLAKVEASEDAKNYLRETVGGAGGVLAFLQGDVAGPRISGLCEMGLASFGLGFGALTGVGIALGTGVIIATGPIGIVAAGGGFLMGFGATTWFGGGCVHQP